MPALSIVESKPLPPQARGKLRIVDSSPLETAPPVPMVAPFAGPGSTRDDLKPTQGLLPGYTADGKRTPGANPNYYGTGMLPVLGPTAPNYSGPASGLLNYMDEGLGRVGEGMVGVGSGRVAGGLHDIFTGGSQAMSPMIAEAALTNPAMALKMAGAGAVSDLAGQGAATLLDATPDQRNLTGDITGTLGGTLIGSSPKVAGFAGGALKKVLPAMRDAWKTEAMAAMANRFMPGPLSHVADAIAAYDVLPPVFRGGVAGAKGQPWLHPSISEFFNPSEPQAPPVRPPWEDPGWTPPVPTETPSAAPGPVPSGRVIPSVEERIARAQTPVPPKPTPVAGATPTPGMVDGFPKQLLDDLSAGGGYGKNYAKLTQDQKAGVLRLAHAYSGTSAPLPVPATSAPPPFVNSVEASLPGGRVESQVVSGRLTPPSQAEIPPVNAPSQGNGFLENLVQGHRDPNAEEIARRHVEIGLDLTDKKNNTIAQHLANNGVTPQTWSQMSLPEQNQWVKRVNAANKTQYKAFGSDYRPGGFGRSAEDATRHIGDILGKIWGQ